MPDFKIMSFGTMEDDVWPIIAMVVFTAFSIWFKRRKNLTIEPTSFPEREPALEMAELENTDRVREAILKRIEERERARIAQVATQPQPVSETPVRVILEEHVEHRPALDSVHQKLHSAKGAREAFKMSVVLGRYADSNPIF